MTTTLVDERVDPRIEARRRAVRREDRRRLARRGLAVLVVLALAACAYGATRTPLLDVDHIRVEGTAHLDPAAVVAASTLRTGTPMLDVDTGRAVAAVAALPWVESVRVQREWPGTVRVSVVERRAAAVVDVAGKGLLLVDRRGLVLEPVAGAPPADLAVVSVAGDPAVPGTVQPGLGYGVAVARSLTADLRGWVTRVQPSADGTTVLVVLRDGMKADLGPEAHLGDKLVDLASVLTGVQLGCIDTIDLRVPHTPVVTRRASC